MAFRFTLQPVLRLRASYERLERLRLLAVVAAIVRVQQGLDLLDAESQQARVYLRDKLAGGMTAGEMQFETVCEKLRVEHRRTLEARLKELAQAQARQRQAYQSAKQKRQVLENLRQRKLDEYRVEQSRREQQGIDELFLLHRGTTPHE